MPKQINIRNENPGYKKERQDAVNNPFKTYQSINEKQGNGAQQLQGQVPSETGSNNAGKGDNPFKNSPPIDIKVEYLRPMHTNAAGGGGNRQRSDSGD